MDSIFLQCQTPVCNSLNFQGSIDIGIILGKSDILDQCLVLVSGDSFISNCNWYYWQTQQLMLTCFAHHAVSVVMYSILLHRLNIITSGIGYIIAVS